jgi:uncharacterized membrane protein HdeD (DUF308 family)
MGEASELSEFEQRVHERFGLNRGLLLAVGVACLGMGAFSVLLPLSFYGSLIQLVGVLLFASGAIKAVQLLLGRYSTSARRRGWPVIVCEVILDVLMGILIFNHWRVSVVVMASAFGLLFLLEGLLLLYMALRSPTATSHKLLTCCGAVTSAIGLVILLRLVNDPLRWAGVFVGIKLLTFGGTLAWIALRALPTDRALVYESAPLLPEAGEAYAVYFGTAFHLGIFIGDGEVVHFLNDNYIYRVPWGQFVAGRPPEHWTYPDLAPAATEVVVRTALSEVGKTYPYSLLRFNCEHFAVYCKSGGQTYNSIYAQIAGGAANVAMHPLLGTVAELNTRLFEWLAFHLGGPSGKRLSLAIRRLGAAVTNGLVALSPGRSASGGSLR